MPVETIQLGNYLESFTEFAKNTERETPAWLRELRELAFARFCSAGFPTTRDEDWRFTNVAGLARMPLQLARKSAAQLMVSDLERWRMRSAAARMVFVDGHFAPDLSTREMLPDRVTANNLRAEITEGSRAVADRLGRYLDIERDPFCALNTAFADDGAYVRVGRGVVVEQPIHLLFISMSSSTPAMTHPRNLIVVEDEGQASIVEEYVSFGAETPALSNAVTELVAGGSAVVSHTLLEREHVEAYNVSTLRLEKATGAPRSPPSLPLGRRRVGQTAPPVLCGAGRRGL